MHACVRDIFFLSFIFIRCTCPLSSGQANIKPDSTTAQQTDIKDVFNCIFKKNHSSDTTMDTGKGPFISVLPGLSYGMNTGFTANITSNTSFYTDNAKTRISSVQANANYSQFHQYWIDVLSNIFMGKKKLHLSGDIRYYKFPTLTYGLGPNSTSSDPLKIDYSYFRFHQVVFHEYTYNFFIGIGYNLDYHWKIKIDSAAGNKLDQFIKNQKGNHSTSSGISLNMMYDTRKNPVNPTGGTFVNVQFRPDLKLLGSDSNWQLLLLEFRHYINLPAASRSILAFWSYNQITLKGNPPYLDLPGIGWDDYSNTGREYAAGRFTGKDLFYLETEYRFPLTRNGLLGGVIFGNAQSIPEDFPSEAHTIIPGGGIGLRIKSDKRSGTNIVIDYGFGVRGSHGIFFSVGEVF